MARPAGRLVPMQNRVPCLLEDRLRNERNGQDTVCRSRQCDGVALGPPLPKRAHGDGQASPEQMLCATLRLSCANRGLYFLYWLMQPKPYFCTAAAKNAGSSSAG